MRIIRHGRALIWSVWAAGLLMVGCTPVEETPPLLPSNRYAAIPQDAVKGTPETDLFPPVSLSSAYATPVPLAGRVNSAGAEDAPVISEDGHMFFFFFTPDVAVPPERQLLDGVSGIWWSHLIAGEWSDPLRIRMGEDIALDGPMCVTADTLWFASFRVGNFRNDGDIYTAWRDGERWFNWQNAGAQLNRDFNIGELCTTRDNVRMIFHRAGSNGYGEYDLWQTERTEFGWSEPENLGIHVNSAGDESHPCLGPDNGALWFTGNSRHGYTGPAIFRCLRSDSGWSAPEEMFANFAGDPAVDKDGNVYFTHHFFSASMEMIEADIYVARPEP